MGARGGSIQLARILGIRIGANPSWFVVLFLLIYLLTGYFGDIVKGSDTQAFALAVAAALLFFVSITLHELGHAVVARRNGIGITGIDLFFFGGVAKLSREAETPGAEFRIAVAGPAVTAAIVALCVGAGVVASRAGEVLDAARFLEDTTTAPYALLGFVAVINVVLLVFNLVPAFPLDGGRIARAIAWRITGDRNRGTRFSGRAGQVFAYVLVGFGAYLLLTSDSVTGLWWIVLGFFLHQAARGAVLSSAFGQRLEGVEVADVMDPEPVTVPGELTALRAEDEFFLRYRWAWFPAVDAAGRFLGILRHGRVEEAIGSGQPALAIAELLEEAPERYRILCDRPLQALLGEPGLQELGALVAVDGDGVVRGVVTLDGVRRALVGTAPDSAV